MHTNEREFASGQGDTEQHTVCHLPDLYRAD